MIFKIDCDIINDGNFGCDLKTKEGLEKTKETIQKTKVELTTLYEATLGVILATFGMFMKRYGLKGISIAKVLVQNLILNYDNGEFYITENIKQCANEAFFMAYKDITSLDDYNSETVATAEVLGAYHDFVMKYLNELFTVTQLEHSSIENQKERDRKKYLNIGAVHECVFDIINQCKELLHIEVTNDSVANKITAALNS